MTYGYASRKTVSGKHSGLGGSGRVFFLVEASRLGEERGTAPDID